MRPGLPEDSEVRGLLAQGVSHILGRPLAPSELEGFSRYLSLLLQWNRVHRLTSYRTSREVVEKLFLDSLLFLRWVEPRWSRVLDLGAGAGIPGLPLRIVEPAIRLTLLEARRYRASFLATVVRELGLEDVQLLSGRAEALIASDPTLRGAFDMVIARAAGAPASILPMALHFLRVGGRFVSSGPPPKGPPPPLPLDLPYRWETAPGTAQTPPRMFLIAEKAY